MSYISLSVLPRFQPAQPRSPVPAHAPNDQGRLTPEGSENLSGRHHREIRGSLEAKFSNLSPVSSISLAISFESETSVRPSAPPMDPEVESKLSLAPSPPGIDPEESSDMKSPINEAFGHPSNPSKPGPSPDAPLRCQLLSADSGIDPDHQMMEVDDVEVFNPNKTESNEETEVIAFDGNQASRSDHVIIDIPMSEDETDDDDKKIPEISDSKEVPELISEESSDDDESVDVDEELRAVLEQRRERVGSSSSSGSRVDRRGRVHQREHAREKSKKNNSGRGHAKPKPKMKRRARRREWELSEESLSPVNNEEGFPSRISPRKKPFVGYTNF